jgi:hypothetical protein
MGRKPPARSPWDGTNQEKTASKAPARSTRGPRCAPRVPGVWRSLRSRHSGRSLRCLRRPPSSSGRPLSVPPCCLWHRASARGGSSGALVSPHLPARAPRCSGTLASLAASTERAPARFLFSEPASRPTASRPGARGGTKWSPRDPGKGRATAPVPPTRFLADSKREGFVQVVVAVIVGEREGFVGGRVVAIVSDSIQ